MAGAMNDADWHVSPHGKLEKLAENLWRVQGSVAGLPMPRVMTVARIADGNERRLVIHSAVALQEESMREIEALGAPAFLLVPSQYHRIDAARFARRYPETRVLCPAGSRARVEAVVRVDGTYDDFGGDGSVRLEHLDGVGDVEGVMRVTSADGTTLVFNDILFNLPHGPGLGGLALRLVGSSGGPRVTRIARTFIVKDHRALARRFVALANGTPDLVRIVVSHCDVIDREPAEALRRVALTL
jgi:hypothetical protein